MTPLNNPRTPPEPSQNLHLSYFLEEKSMLETVINATGHEVIFYPKFHCELNYYIEYYWSAVKRYARANCQ